MKFLANSVRRILFIYRPIYQSTRAFSFSNSNNNEQTRWNTCNKILISSVIAGCLGYYAFDKQRKYVFAEASKSSDESGTAGKFKEGLPSFSLREISDHTSKDTKVWVTYKEGVYDITDFVDKHPGGDQILIAAGSSVEPFWLLYGVHENKHVYMLLESYRIGNLSKEDVGTLSSDLDDPYSKDPVRHPVLKPTSAKPFNAEIPPPLLVESFITPNELFYVRNHLPVPDIDPNTYELEVELEGRNKRVTFTLDELKKLPKCTITAAIMCAGNRRGDMTKVKPVKGLNWGPGAVGNAVWTGVRLRDVLGKAGVDEDDARYKHVKFEGIDFDVTGNMYGASIPIWKALDKRGDVLLAYEMNGVPIPRDHGFPIRVVVPGVVGARNVKWLGKITVSEKESDSHWQQNDYKGFSPSTDWDTVDFTKSPAIQELPVISAICQPCNGDNVEVVDGHILVRGYAWSGGGQKIVRVDVTVDAGKTWHVAHFDGQDSSEPPQHWAWTLWSIRIPVEKHLESVEIWAKAVDSSYNTQPESFENIWNLRGVLGNAYHRVKVKFSQ
ncbi:sulfite oxidase [Anoplophora glabripennis]|uniref:sulfite oxidase n=1 Tax=Anoplophora glabripennis TaxID=217634 RepID=UPI0008748332|nr:sulfite oxidase [Anoplophora glabripennis]